jgi:hypothetical protein
VASKEEEELVALAWVRGDIDSSAVARAYGIPKTRTSEICQRLAQALKAWILRREENVTGSDAQIKGTIAAHDL